MKALHVLAAAAVVGGVVTSHGGVTNVTAGGPLYGTITQAAAAGAARVWLGEALVQEFPAAAWENGTGKVTNPDGTKASLKIKAGAPPVLQLQLVLPDVLAGLPLRIALGNGAVYAEDVMPDAKGRFP